jgi:hypothetical protein
VLGIHVGCKSRAGRSLPSGRPTRPPKESGRHSNLSCQIDLSAIIAVTDLISPTPPILTGIGTLAWHRAEAFGRAYQHHCSLPCTTQGNRYGSSLCRKNQHSPLHQKTSCPLQRSTRIGLGYGRGYSSWPSSSRDSSVRCEEKAGTRICCSQDDFKSSHGCCNQGQAIYTKSTRTRVVTMCQNQGHTIYTRNARTRIVAIKLNMPQPFLCVSAGLVHTSEFSPGEMGAVTTSFHFKGLRSQLPSNDFTVAHRWHRPIAGVLDRP